ncbi:hypothetical protein BH09CHL1_BH09CHL1_15470 [soil metagenome]
MNVAILDSKRNAPISAYGNGVVTAQGSLQLMKIHRRLGHIGSFNCDIEQQKDSTDSLHHFRWELAPVSGFEETFEPLVAEAGDHRLIVKCQLTLYK